MTRILLLETASPMRVRRKAEQMLAEGNTSLTILCGDAPGAAQSYCGIGDVEIIGLSSPKRSLIANDLRERHFDAIHVFWTGEEEYRQMKWFALRLGAGRMVVDAGDGCVFRLTWKATLRFWLFRRKHPLPSDYYEFVPRPAPEPVSPSPSPPEGQKAPEAFSSQKILVLQTAEPQKVLRALDLLRERTLFANPRYILLCRNRPDVLQQFQGHPLLTEIRTHHETKDSWKLLRTLRHERLEVAVIFLTGEPGYWKIKCFAFLVGARHELIFNENNDCFYFNWRSWFSLLSHRLQHRSGLPVRQPWPSKVQTACLILIKALVLPFRFVWLLAVWLRLRAGAARTSD